MSADSDATQLVLAFWFDELGPEQWWGGSAEVDETIRARFGELWAQWRERPAESFLGSADAALAGVILFDQFPRNMFRGSADAFATDSLALAIARGALDHGLDRGMTNDRLCFLYMPFEHSEDLADQERSLLLFAALDDPRMLAFARAHHDMIARFGRFPARNAALGRANRPGEAEAIADSKDW